MLKMSRIISPYTVEQAAFDLQQKETGSKTVAIATSKYTSCGAFLSIQSAYQIPISLHHYLQRYSLFCVLTSILSHLMTSTVPNLHNTKILKISGTTWDMTKRKTPFFFTFKGLSNSPIFQYLNFSFHRHFKPVIQEWSCTSSSRQNCKVYSAKRITVATQETFKFDNKCKYVYSTTEQRCSTYNCASFASRSHCQSNSHILLGGQFVKELC